MELGKQEVHEATTDAGELDFDPDKLIGDPETKECNAPAESPEAVLHDPDAIYEFVEGLSETRQGFQELENGNTIFNTPHETGRTLNYDQGVYSDVQGDCGLVSIENVCRLAGKDLSEADVVTDAISTDECYYNPAECQYGNGGTSLENIRTVLNHFGIESDIQIYPGFNDVADAVESGKGVIACVDTTEYDYEAFGEGQHAITVTSVEREPSGGIVAFYVCDSGSGDGEGCKRVDVDIMEKSLFAIVITADTIR